MNQNAQAQVAVEGRRVIEEVDLAAHLANLVNFHHDDEYDDQLIDPISICRVEGERLVITLESGAIFEISVKQL